MSEENNSGSSSQQPGCGDCFCGGAGPAISDALRKLGPSEGAKRHFNSARVEFLKGIRALIDARIESLSSTESKGTRVTVE